MGNGPFIGKVEIEDTVNKFTTVTLDGDKAAISVGGKAGGFSQVGQPVPAYNGVLTVLDKEGTLGGQLQGYLGGVLLLNGPDGKQRLYIHNGTFNLGGNGNGGTIGLFPTNAGLPGTNVPFRPSIRFNADGAQMLVGGNGWYGQLVMFPETATTDDYFKATVRVSARDAMLTIGGAGVDGSVMVLGKDGKSRVELNGITGDVILTNADCAEEFDVAVMEAIEPGTVVAFDDDGRIAPSSMAYDRRVAGVISGAGEFKHGILLDKRVTGHRRLPVALVGKVYCRVDAEFSPVAAGDLLTTSPTPGYAMKAIEPGRSFGAVLGKALRPLRSGRDLIPILVTLQ